MRKKIFCGIICLVVMMVCAAAFSTEYILIRPAGWTKGPYGSKEWSSADSDPAVVHGSTVFSSYPTVGKNDTNGRQGFGALDIGYLGDMGAANQNAYHQYYAGTMYQLGSSTWKSHPWGEGRWAMTYDLGNTFGWVRSYDNTKFGPSAAVTTGGVFGDADGDGYDLDDFSNTTTGPCKNVFRGDATATMYTGGYGYYNPVHLNLDSTTAVTGAVSMQATVNRVMWIMSLTGRSYTSGSAQPPLSYQWAGPAAGKSFEIIHTQPPITQIDYNCLDNVWGSHSTGSNYKDRTIFREDTASLLAGVDSSASSNYGVGATSDPYNFDVDPRTGWKCITRIATNYPTSRQGALGQPIIDILNNKTNDQYIYHDAGDSDPLIDSIIADMRAGRTKMWFTAKATAFYGDGWKQNDWEFICYTPYRASSIGTMFIELGDPATAEDWVLYK